MDAAREEARAARIEQRRILGDYYRELSVNYLDYEVLAKTIGPTLAFPARPNIPEYENA
jgi:hypothetical protein